MTVTPDILELLLHVDKYLSVAVQDFGIWVYLLLFMTIFLETGFVVTPFLPGDSLLFVVGTLAAAGSLNLAAVVALLAAAAIAGDTVNYWLGRHVGYRILKKTRFVKKEHLDMTQKFYEKHGGKTIVIARFMPVVRTFAPFVAGIGRMRYSYFLAYNVIGGAVWVGAFVLAGNFFGNIPVVKENLSVVLLAIIGASIIVPLMGFLRHTKK